MLAFILLVYYEKLARVIFHNLATAQKKCCQLTNEEFKLINYS